jgi:hypothetical protein
MSARTEYRKWCKLMWLNPTPEGLRAWDAATKLAVKNFTDSNTARAEICRCECGGKWALLHQIIPSEPLNYCSNCGGKLLTSKV